MNEPFDPKQLAAPFPVEATAKPAATAATPIPTTTPASWGLMDVLTIPLQASEPQTRAFHAKGRDWPVTIRTDALDDPQEFYRLAILMSQTKKTVKSITVAIEEPSFTLTNASYIAALQVLARVAIAPAFGVDEWAEFGRRVGGPTISAIVNFALEATGLSEGAIEEDMTDAGEPGGAAP